MLEKKEIVPYKDPDLVILRNPVAKAKFGLSLVQTKILFEVIAFFKNNPEARLMRFYIRDYLNKLGLDSHNLKSYVDEIESMTRLHLQIPEGENRKGINYLAVNLFAGARFRIDEQGFGYVDIEVSEMLKPYFLEIAKGDFFYYHIVNTRILKSTYSIKLYLLLKSYKRFRTLDITVVELRNILEIHPDEYQRYKDFKKRILERARIELKEKNDIFFTYDEIRARPNNQKSEVVKISFHINDNPDSQEVRDKVKSFEKQSFIKGKNAIASQSKLEIPFIESIEKIESLPYSLENTIMDFTPTDATERVETSEKLQVISLFKTFDNEATEKEITEFLDGLPQNLGAILDVLLYAQNEQKKGNTIKSIYAYIVSGLKTGIGKGMAAKERAKREKANSQRKMQEENAQIKGWFENEFRPFEVQHYYDLGADADTEIKKKYLLQKRTEAETNPSIKKQFFTADGGLNQDALRLAMGIELSKNMGESTEALFKKWANEKKNVVIDKEGSFWVIKEELIF
jgi:plasmid replication initiation protein